MPLDSSPAISSITTPAEGTETATQILDTTTPASSTGTTTQAEGAKPEGSIVDAVTSALKKPEGEASPASTKDQTTSDPSKSGQPEKDEPLPLEISKEELEAQKPQTRKRMEQLLGQAKDLKGQLDTLSPKAQEFDKMVNFIAANNLSTADVNSGFELMALIQRDPAQARERLVPIMAQLDRLVGEVLPADLQERVRLGYISEQDARELNRSRAGEQLARRQAQETETRTAEAREQERRQGIVRDVSSAMSEWEAGKKASDPDFHLKQERIEDLIHLDVHRNGYPQTKADAIERINKIHDRVTKELRRFIPAPKEKSPTIGGASTQTVAEPKSILEAVRIGLSK